MVTNKSLSFRLGESRFWSIKTAPRSDEFYSSLSANISTFFNSILCDPIFRDRGIVHSHNQITFGRSHNSAQFFIQDAKLLDFFNTFPRKNLFSAIRRSHFYQRSVSKKVYYNISKNKFFFKKKNLFFDINRPFSFHPHYRFCYNFASAKNRFIQIRLRRFRKHTWKRQQYNFGFRDLFYSQKNFRTCFFLFFSRFFSASISAIYFIPSKVEFKHISSRITTANIYLNYITAKLYYRYILSDVVNPIVRLSLKLYRGFAINCKGRFTRAQIASQKHYRKGSLAFGKVSTPLDYAQKSVVLKYGVCNFKLWIRHLFFIYTSQL